jgi:arginine exporter protein ArgO
VLDLWKRDNFRVKDAVLLCCFLLGMRFLVELLRWRKVPLAVFCALLVMYFGLEIIRREIGNVYPLLQ